MTDMFICTYISGCVLQGGRAKAQKWQGSRKEMAGSVDTYMVGWGIFQLEGEVGGRWSSKNKFSLEMTKWNLILCLLIKNWGGGRIAQWVNHVLHKPGDQSVFPGGTCKDRGAPAPHCCLWFLHVNYGMCIPTHTYLQ